MVEAGDLLRAVAHGEGGGGDKKPGVTEVFPRGQALQTLGGQDVHCCVQGGGGGGSSGEAAWGGEEPGERREAGPDRYM